MQGILVVSFGTVYDETRERNIGAIEQELEQLGMPVYSAFTSDVIRASLAKRNHVIMSVSEAVCQMHMDGIEGIFVVSTFLTCGREYEKMKRIIEEMRSVNIRMVRPLLSTASDIDEVLQQIQMETRLDEDEAIILMGHGNNHGSGFIYQEIACRVKEKGYTHVFVGTIEGEYVVDRVIEEVKRNGYKKVLILPFMLVAGKHVYEHVELENESGWNMRFERAGIKVRVQIKGLGEYVGIRNLYKAHLLETMKEHEMHK